MPDPSPICTINGSSSSGGVNVERASTVTIQLASLAGVQVWSITCIYADESNDAAAVTSGLSINTTTKTATFTAPTVTNGTALIFQSKVRDALGTWYTTTFGVYTLAKSGMRIGAPNETTEGSNTHGWVTKLNEVIRQVDGSGSVVSEGFSSDANRQASDAAARAQTITLTSVGSLTATRQYQFTSVIQAPAGKKWTIHNNTTGGQSITVNINGGTGVTIANGETLTVRSDGTAIRHCNTPGAGGGSSAPAGAANSLVRVTGASAFVDPTADLAFLTDVGGTNPRIAQATSKTITLGLTGATVACDDSADTVDVTATNAITCDSASGDVNLDCGNTRTINLKHNASTIASVSSTGVAVTGQVTASTFIGIGASPATSGDIRSVNPFTLKTKTSGGTTFTLLGYNGSDQATLGDATNPLALLLEVGGGGSIYPGRIAGSDKLIITTSELQIAKPIVGETFGTSPYSAHGGVSHTFASDANYTVTAAQYKFDIIEFVTGSWTAQRTVTFPHPATLAAAYYKTVYADATHGVVVSTGTGTTKTIAAGNAQRLKFSNAGVSGAGAAFTP